MDLKYIIFNKPYGVVSQFSKIDNKPTLSDYLTIEKNVYPVGRLDTDSEGLLLLTNDTTINALLLKPEKKYAKKYLVQVEHEISLESIVKLSQGVTITIDSKPYKTMPCNVTKASVPDFLWERNPPIRFRKTVPTSWIEITLTEGKNRQIRKMTAQVGHPTLRLIRVQIGYYCLSNLQPGEFIYISKSDIY